MTALNKQALREKIKSKREFFDTQTIIEVDVLEALLDELEASEKRIAETNQRNSEPTEDMIVNWFESEPDESFSDERE